MKPKRLAADTAYGTGRSLAGWLVAGLLHIFQFATQASAMTAPFRAVTFAGTEGVASTFVRITKCYTPPAPCTTATCSATVPPNSTAMRGGDHNKKPTFSTASATTGLMQRSKKHLHSTTPSVRARSDGGMVRPSALAVWRFMTRSNLDGCSIGKSAGLSPLRIRSI